MKNSVELVGRLTADAESKSLASGELQASVRLAINRVYRKSDKTLAESTTFLTVRAFRAQAEVLKNLKQSDCVSVKGRLRSYDFEKDGAKSTRLEVEALEARKVERSEIEE